MFQQLVGVDGRISRLGFLIRQVVVYMAALVAVGFVVSGLEILIVAGLVLYIAALVVSFCSTIRRFHDFGWSGWMVFMMLIPFFGIVVAFMPLFRPGNSLSNDYGFRPDGLRVGKRRPEDNSGYAGADSDANDRTQADDGYRAADDFKTSVATEERTARTSVGSAPAPAAPAIDDRTIVETAPRSTGAWITVQSGAEAGQVIGLTEDVTRIGRSSDNHIVLSDATLSRSHAVIRKSGDDYEISDLGSSAGVTVNGQRISGSDISSGSTIKVGQTELVATEIDTAEQLPETDPKSDRTMVATPGQTRYVLLCKSGPQAGMSFSVGEGSSTLGRDTSSDIHIDDPVVSRKHATLNLRSGKLTISDEGSSGGTFVNGQRLSGTRISNDTTIALGNVRLTFICPAPS